MKNKESFESIQIYEDNGQDYRQEWGELLQGSEDKFPTKASVNNHFFEWPHYIDDEYRPGFDCTKENSFRLIPPRDYLAAYYRAKREKKIDPNKRII